MKADVRPGLVLLLKRSGRVRLRQLQRVSASTGSFTPTSSLHDFEYLGDRSVNDYFSETEQRGRSAENTTPGNIDHKASQQQPTPFDIMAGKT